MASRSANFVAIDFETADPSPDSACAVGMIRVLNSRVVERRIHLIRPPRPYFHFSHIHGITWEDCKSKPTFQQLWPTIRPMLEGADFLAAHNASFDRRVLSSCCAAAGVDMPPLPFLCTVKLARRMWNVRPTKLPDVCRFLALQLNHHEALSDADACARIVIAALQDGADPLEHL